MVQPGVLGLGLLEDGDVGVGIFPEGQEILVSGAALASVPCQAIGAGQTEMRQGTDGLVRNHTGVVDNPHRWNQ